MLMILIPFFVTLVGLVFGSFADAIAWRLHTKRDFIRERSECEHCHHKLGLLDLIPVLSWFVLRGKCRYCKKPIPPLVPLVEVGMGVAFLVSYLFWPLGFETWQGALLFGFWLVYLVCLGILLVYDIRWGLLPDAIVYPLVALGFVDAGLRATLMPDASIALYAGHVVLGIAAMAGIYGFLYFISKGRLVGMGDIKLAVFMGSVLGWQKTLTLLMLANIIGLIVVAPGLLTRRLTPKSRVPFGPFMIVAFVIVGLFGDALIQWYLQTFVLV